MKSITIITMIFSIVAMIILAVSMYLLIINFITSTKMDFYDKKRVELWPKPESFYYSAKWFKTAKWRDKMLPFLPATEFNNHDSTFDAYPRDEKSRTIIKNILK